MGWATVNLFFTSSILAQIVGYCPFLLNMGLWPFRGNSQNARFLKRPTSKQSGVTWQQQSTLAGVGFQFWGDFFLTSQSPGIRGKRVSGPQREAHPTAVCADAANSTCILFHLTLAGCQQAIQNAPFEDKTLIVDLWKKTEPEAQNRLVGKSINQSTRQISEIK